MNLKQTFAKVVAGENLSVVETEEAFTSILTDEDIPDALIGAFIAALRTKREGISEIIGTARAVKVAGGYPAGNARTDFMDICGTGGDGANTVNISTASAFVLAAAELCLPVAKHCGGSSSGTSGSLNVLRELGVVVAENYEEALEYIERYRLAFLSAPAFYPALGRISRIRKEIGGRTILNFALPLTNPLGVNIQLIGVPNQRLAIQMTEAARQMGGRDIGVLFSSHGVDEAMLEGVSSLCESVFESTKHERRPTHEHEIRPEHLSRFGMRPSGKSLLRVENAIESAFRIRAVLMNREEGPLMDTIALNAGAGLLIGGACDTWNDGVLYAQKLLRSGAAGDVFRAMQK